MSPEPSPLPSLASQQLCHPHAPAVPEAVAPPPAALCAWCRLEELPALLAFHLLPPLWVGGEVRLLKDESSCSVLKRIPCSTSFPLLLYLASNSQCPPHNPSTCTSSFSSSWLAPPLPSPPAFPHTGLTLLAKQHVDVGRDAQGSVSNVLEESGLALAGEREWLGPGPSWEISFLFQPLPAYTSSPTPHPLGPTSP